jgi:hypothetical protein
LDKERQGVMNRISLIILTLFVALGAIFGGAALIVEAELGLDVAWLDGTPFSSYVIPGYILVIAVGGSNLVAGVLLLEHHRYAIFAGFAAGAILTGWISVQVAMLGLTTFLQPLYFFFGLLTIALSWRMWMDAEREFFA